MPTRAVIVLLLGCALGACAQTQSSLAQATECARQRTPAACDASRQDIKKAEKIFDRGVRLRTSGRTEASFQAFEEAARLVPRDVEFLSAREITRQQLVLDHLDRGNDLVAKRQQEQATAEFRAALELDPSNSFALQRLRDSAAEAVPQPKRALRVEVQSEEIHLAPKGGRRTYQYRGDSKGLINTIARDFGVRATLDDSVPARQVRFDAGDVDFYTAMRLVGLMTRTFWVPFSRTEMLVAADNPQAHAQFDRMLLRTFYLPDLGSAQDINDIVNAFRTLFDIRFIVPQPAASTIMVRAPQPLLDAATAFLQDLDAGRPQVMLDVQVLEINQSMLRNFGLDLPLQFQAFNVTSAALALLQQPNVQDLINQLIASGGINQANSQTVSALLAQLQNQQNSLFKQPIGTFGGGKTLFAVPFPPATVSLSMNESRATSLQHLTVRASQGNPATVRIGERYPILNATFAPIFNSPALSQVIQNNSFATPFPSFTFEDLGLIVKATPQVHGDSDITLDLEMQIKALTGESINGVPVLSNREYKGTISLRDGESGVVAGMLQRSQQNLLTGIPGLARVPLVNQAAASHDKQYVTGELLVLITPHIVRMREGANKEVWMPNSK